MHLFDTYIFTDWSARNVLGPNTPDKHGIWVGESTPDAAYQKEQYCAGRHAASVYILERLLHHVALDHRVLIGFDFAYSYPHGFATALDLPYNRHAWWAIWMELYDRIVDRPDNSSNRFLAASDLNKILGRGTAGPFWGGPSQSGN